MTDLDLDPHQEVARGWLRTYSRAGLADEMRVGKTAPAIWAALDVGARSVLVLCPPAVRDNWHREIDAWGRAYRGKHDFQPVTRWEVESYDTFWRRSPAAQAARWDTIILDEAHYLRNHSAKRSRAIWGPRALGQTPLLQDAERVWLLTGTPMVNDATDLWAAYRALGWTDLSYVRWRERYCRTLETRFGLKVLGNKKETIEELRALFRKHFLRRMFSEVHAGRPEPLLWRTTVLTPAELSAELAELESSEDAARYREILVAGRETDKGLDETVARIRRLTALEKGPVTASHVGEYLVSSPRSKVLLLGWHEDPLYEMAVLLAKYRPVTFTGKTSDAERRRAITRFQEDPRCRVFIGNIMSCGTGLDLSAASAVVMHETTWVPGENIQAAMRAVHRNKRAPVPVDLVTLAGTIDEAVTRVRARKIGMMDDVYNQTERGRKTDG
jgi:SNF2 family DNA or RNA helicase